MNEIAKKLLDESPESDSSLTWRRLVKAVNEKDYATAARLSHQCGDHFLSLYNKARASKMNDTDGSDLSKVRTAALEFFKSWDEEDLLTIKAAANLEELNDAVYDFAQAIGERKGWGAEGIGELHGEFQTDLEKLSGVDSWWDQ